MSVRGTTEIPRFVARCLVIAAIGVFTPVHSLNAQVVWDGGGDGVNWHDPDNWSTDMLPGALDDVIISSGTVE